MCLGRRNSARRRHDGLERFKRRDKKLDRKRKTARSFSARISRSALNLFYRIADFASELFAKFDDYEAFIEEQHHSKKLDAPSGTALKLKDVVANHITKDFSVSGDARGKNSRNSPRRI